ncbi:epoxyqueuosine reductase QueG [Methanolinea mesophila]|uniref:epoxyqueuosine reductase n=1 Tax=Methanolinea mesophila TaxID=547055 RepID=UPI00315928D6|nr:epoxyqueuosine reductase QueG [Methanolinea mesophila]
MDPQEKQRLLEKCRDMEIPLVGVAPVERWEDPPFLPWMPEEFYPRSVYPEARSVIVVGLPVSLPVLETTPSIWYHELYKTVNILLDQYTYRLANFLTGDGYPSVFVPRDGYGSAEVLKENPVAFFSHRHAAYLAGLGTFGVNNTVLTPAYGPRVRFGSVITTAELPPDPLMTGQLCTRCMRCVRSCPARALDEGAYPEGLTDKSACTAHSIALGKRSISPCGICIKVCPVGEDRRVFAREDLAAYDTPEGEHDLHRAWRHVRAYGGRRSP